MHLVGAIEGCLITRECAEWNAAKRKTKITELRQSNLLLTSSFTQLPLDIIVYKRMNFTTFSDDPLAMFMF